MIEKSVKISYPCYLLVSKVKLLLESKNEGVVYSRKKIFFMAIYHFYKHINALYKTKKE